MARKKKLYNYEFADCKQALPSSVEVRCSISGEKIKMYHKQLVKLIKNKYRNRWELFKTSYIKKGNKPSLYGKDGNMEEYNTRPEGYRKYLITSYMSFKKDSKLTASDRAAKLDFLNKCYFNRWGGELEEVIQNAEVNI